MIHQLYNIFYDTAGIFLILLTTSFLISFKFQWPQKFLKNINIFIERRGLAANQNLNSIIIKVNLVRIATGCIFLIRMYLVFIYQYASNAPLSYQLLSLFLMLCGFLMMIGLFTPIAALLLLFLVEPSDFAMSNYTLGTDVLQMLLIALAFLPAGSALSLDAFLSKKPFVNRIVTFIYGVFGSITIQKVNLLGLLVLVSYGMLCIYSCLAHYNDPAWLHGYAIPVLLTGSYLDKQFMLFRYIYEHYQSVAIIFSLFATYMMMLWELFFIPLALMNRYTRGFLVIWGILFFIISTFFLQLSMLTYYEFALWALLFWQKWRLNPANEKIVDVFFDDRCNLCDRTVRFLHWMDRCAIIAFYPLSKNEKLLNSHGISTQAGLQNLYGIVGGKVYSGYDLYIYLAANIILLFPIYPILLIGKLFFIGPISYRWIAKRRIKLFGVCYTSQAQEKISSGAAAAPNLATTNSKSQLLLQALYVTYAFCLFIFILRIPVINTSLHLQKLANASMNWLHEPTRIAALVPIDVFNKDDLRLNTNYYTVSRINNNGTTTLLAFTGRDGRRLKWHESDRVYFGNSLGWRRGHIFDVDTCTASTGDIIYLRRLAAIDRHINRQGIHRYLVDYYYQKNPTVDINKFSFKTHKIKPVCSAIYDREKLTILEKKHQANKAVIS